MEWYRKAADLGEPSGLWGIGRLYEEGIGVVQDDQEALAWYKKAVDAGCSVAQNSIDFLKERQNSYRMPPGTEKWCF